MTQSYALVPVSRATYNEVRAKMEAADYGHQLLTNPRDPGSPRLVMHGLALVPIDPPADPDHDDAEPK